MSQWIFIFLAIIVIIFILILVVWLFFDHGIDKIKNREEWKDAGSSGERIVYKTLVEKFKIPEKQILRNVYIPVAGRTSEIDLIVISTKGIFIFECKNYGGNIYGDAKRQKWVQYIGNKKCYFYNPIFQNKNHEQNLRGFLEKNGIKAPIIPLITTTSRGKWKIKNLDNNDHILGINCHLRDIFRNTPKSELAIKNYKKILESLSPLSRPSDEIRKAYIDAVTSRT